MHSNFFSPFWSRLFRPLGLICLLWTAVGEAKLYAQCTTLTVNGGGTICSGGSTNVSIGDARMQLLQPGVTYTLLRNGAAMTSTTASSVYPISWNVNQEGTYTVRASGGSCYNQMMSGSAAVTVNTSGGSASVSNVSGGGVVCGSGPATLSAYGTAGTYNWYEANTGTLKGTVVSTGGYTSWTTPPLSASTAYDVTVTVTNACGQAVTSAKSRVTAIVNTSLPTAPTVGAGSVSRCGSGVVTLSASTGNSAWGLSWYDVATGGTSLGNGTSFSPSVTASKSFWVASVNLGANNTGDRCESATRTEVKVVVTAPNSAVGGTLSGSVSVTYGDNQGALTLSGHTGIIAWQKSEDGGLTWQATGTMLQTTCLYSGLTVITQFRAMVATLGCGASVAYSNTITITILFNPNWVHTRLLDGSDQLIPGVSSDGLTYYSPEAIVLPLLPALPSTVKRVVSGKEITLAAGVTLAADMELIITTVGSGTGIASESRSYFDYAGKPLQTQSRNLGTGQLLATEPMYGRYGNTVGQTLVAPVGTGAFSYVPNFVTNGGTAYGYDDFDDPVAGTINAPRGVDATSPLGKYYSVNNDLEPYVGQTTYPYSRNETYSDGSGEAKRASNVGDELRMGKGREPISGSFPVVHELGDGDVNTANNLDGFYLDVRSKYFTTDEVGILPTVLKGQAYQQVAIDASGVATVAITDADGKPLMSAMKGTWLTVNNSVSLNAGDLHRFYLLEATTISVAGSYELINTLTDAPVAGTALSVGFYRIKCLSGTVTLGYTNRYGDISYTFYDHLGRSLAAIAPNGVKLLTTNKLSAYATKASIPFVNLYEYDQRGRLLARTEPDAGRSEFAYRKDDKLRFSQNAEQRKTSTMYPYGRYSYIEYDEYERAIELGEYIPVTADMSFINVKTKLFTPVAPDIRPPLDIVLSGGTRQDWVKTTYDVAVAGSGRIQDFMMGLVSYTESAATKSWYSYDEQGKVTWMLQSITGLTGLKAIDYSYDFLGKVQQVAYQKGQSDAFFHYYSYDADGRLAKVETSRDPNGAIRTLQAKYNYYLHGPLKRVELGNKLQGIDYVYTVQGWLKSINNANVSQDPGQDGSNGVAADVFGMSLDYFSGDYTNANAKAIAKIPSLTGAGLDSYPAYYDSRIRVQSWQNSKLAVTASYAYQYTVKGQLLAAKFGTPDFAGSNFTAHATDYHLSSLAYDANGNLLGLNQGNRTSGGFAADNFTNSYWYKANNTNDNALSQSSYFTNRLGRVDTYASFSYNAIGQLSSQTAIGSGVQSMNQISYEVSGKVKEVRDGANALKLSFTYNERGRRASTASGGITTYYIYAPGGQVMAIYEGNTLKELPIYGSDRIGALYTGAAGLYQYELKDQLGNVRVVLNADKVGGNAVAMNATDYLPFGGIRLSTVGNPYRYGYQGQYAEKDDETGWNSFEMRMYDARIGRWLAVDPDRQFASPYVGMGNNPTSNVDKDGRFVIPLQVIIAAGAATLNAGVTAYQIYKENGGKFENNTKNWSRVGVAFVAGGLAGAGFGGLNGAIAIAVVSNGVDQAIKNDLSTDIKKYSVPDLMSAGLGAYVVGRTGEQFGAKFYINAASQIVAEGVKKGILEVFGAAGGYGWGKGVEFLTRKPWIYGELREANNCGTYILLRQEGDDYAQGYEINGVHFSSIPLPEVEVHGKQKNRDR